MSEATTHRKPTELATRTSLLYDETPEYNLKVLEPHVE
jgi:hypothetical protein